MFSILNFRLHQLLHFYLLFSSCNNKGCIKSQRENYARNRPVRLAWKLRFHNRCSRTIKIVPPFGRRFVSRAVRHSSPAIDFVRHCSILAISPYFSFVLGSTAVAAAQRSSSRRLRRHGKRVSNAALLWFIFYLSSRRSHRDDIPGQFQRLGVRPEFVLSTSNSRAIDFNRNENERWIAEFHGEMICSFYVELFREHSLVLLLGWRIILHSMVQVYSYCHSTFCGFMGTCSTVVIDCTSILDIAVTYVLYLQSQWNQQWSVIPRNCRLSWCK